MKIEPVEIYSTRTILHHYPSPQGLALASTSFS
jgi:hypothetical protein